MGLTIKIVVLTIIGGWLFYKLFYSEGKKTLGDSLLIIFLLLLFSALSFVDKSWFINLWEFQYKQ
jgi:hypothetical protein